MRDLAHAIISDVKTVVSLGASIQRRTAAANETRYFSKLVVARHFMADANVDKNLVKSSSSTCFP